MHTQHTHTHTYKHAECFHNNFFFFLHVNVLNNVYFVAILTTEQDMTSRDLLQQRITLANGDTSWRYSPLVLAALEGSIAELDGIHRVNPGTLAVLQRLDIRQQAVSDNLSTVKRVCEINMLHNSHRICDAREVCDMISESRIFAHGFCQLSDISPKLKTILWI